MDRRFQSEHYISQKVKDRSGGYEGYELLCHHYHYGGETVHVASLVYWDTAPGYFVEILNATASVPLDIFEEFIAETIANRSIFGNPFRPEVADPAWLTSTVLALVEGIDRDRAFDRMPILADALQDAGCNNDDILIHCRQPGAHVRGCWVIDLLMGRFQSDRYVSQKVKDRREGYEGYELLWYKQDGEVVPVVRVVYWDAAPGYFVDISNTTTFVPLGIIDELIAETKANVKYY